MLKFNDTFSGYAGEEITFEADGLTIAARLKSDDDTTPPWEREDGHGPVSDWTRREKAPGELVLNEDRGARRYYDFAEAVKIARRDGWGIDNPPEGATCRQIAALAAREDFERLRRWCNDQWEYVGVVVTVSARGLELGSASLWGIESDCTAYLLETANELLPEALEEARKGAVGLLSVGDRIKFRSPVRDGARTVWRSVTGFDSVGRPEVSYWGCKGFVVRPEEVKAVQFNHELEV